MRKELEELALLDQYLDNELSADQKLKFEQRLKNEHELRQAVEDQKALRKGIERSVLIDEIEAAKNRGKGGNPFKFIIPVIVLVALLIFSLYPSKTEKEEKKKNTDEQVYSDKIQKETFSKETRVNKTKSVNKRTRKNNINANDSIKHGPDSLSQARAAQVSTTRYKNYDVEQQSFVIENSKENKIVGKQGTIIVFPENAFKTDGEIEIKLKEYYSPADIVLSGLSTNCGDDWIETRGMIEVLAYSDGKEVSLDSGVYYPIAFPKSGYPHTSGLKTFYGKEVENKLDWQVDSTYYFLPCPNRQLVDKYGSSIWLQEKEIKYAQEFLRNFCFTRSQVKVISGNVVYPEAYIELRIKKGRIVEQIIETKNEFYEEVLEEYISSINLEYLLEESKTYTARIKLAPPNGLDAENQSLSKLCLDDLNAFENIENIIVKNYIISSNKLGLINCDRFTGAKTVMKQQVFETEEDCFITIIPSGSNSYLNALKDDDIWVCTLPENVVFSVVAHKRIGMDQYLASFRRFKSGKGPIIVDNFQLYNKKELAKKINKLKKYKE